MRTAIVTLLLTLSAAAQVKLPPSTRQVLPNGAVLILAAKPDVPLMTIQIVLRGGDESDPVGMSGVSSITAELIRRGTASRTSDQIAEQLDFLGASLTTGSDEQSVRISSDFLAKDLDKVLEILTDVMAHPTFPEAEVKKILAQRTDAAKAAKDSPGQAIGLYFRPYFFPAGHPYHGVADEIALAKIGREQIAGYHKRMFAGKNMIVVATGDFDAKAAGPKLAAMAEALPAGDAYAWAKATTPKFGSARLLLIDKADATQTYFEIAQPGIDHNSPDRVALDIVNTLFGGRFTSMLNDELRVNSGLTYGARSYYDRERLAGALAISTYTRTDATEKAIDVALDLLKRLNEKGLNAEQLASAKAYIKGGFPTQRLETATQVGSVLAELELFGQGKGEIDDLFSKIDSVSIEKANEIARKYYRLDNLQFILVGNAAKIQDSVKKYAPKMKVVPVKDPGFETPVF
jgi:zinc protease